MIEGICWLLLKRPNIEKYYSEEGDVASWNGDVHGKSIAGQNFEK